MPADTLLDLDFETLITPDELVRSSGVMKAIQQQAFDIRMRQAAQEEGFQVARISHHHHPAVEMVMLRVMGDMSAIRLRLLSKVYRLFVGTGIPVPKRKLSVRSRHDVVRVACLPNWG